VSLKQFKKFPIIFEDQDILVINKAPGVVVNRAKTVKTETIQDMMEDSLKDWQDISQNEWIDLVPDNFSEQWGTPKEIFKKRMGIVHRLDKNTSGVLVLAKNPGSLVSLLDQFKSRTVSKKYRCLVHGKLKLKEGEIDAPLGRARKDRKKFTVTIEGRAAVTKYKMVKEYDFAAVEAMVVKLKENVAESDQEKKIQELNKKIRTYQQGFSLIECEPKTGRTHQIRVHMKHLDHPLAGDSFYTGRKRSKLDAVWCPRQFLHASELEFMHPRSKEKVSFKAELGEDLDQVLGLLNGTEL